MRIRVRINGPVHELDVPPTRRLLDILRENLVFTGSKEGCGEGECGACAVFMDGMLVNACLVPALQLEGRDVKTVEALRKGGTPDPVQTAFVEEGGVQCGFCTPGMVMAAKALLEKNPHPSREEIRAGLAGNLCRCTGYEKIIAAVQKVAEHYTPSQPPEPCAGAGEFSPTTLAEAIEILKEHGERITIVAGATDLMISLKLGLLAPDMLMDVTRIASLAAVTYDEDVIEIGSTVTYAELADHPVIKRHCPALVQAAVQVGAAAIQNRATLGGNLMSASPAADGPVVLMALGAMALLAGPAGRREVPLADFFTGYRQTARQGDELLAAVRIPLSGLTGRQAFYKVGTRRAMAISKTALACHAHVTADGRVEVVRLAAGSVAPTAVRLTETEAFLEGRALDADAILRARDIAATEIAPIDDIRSSELYRRKVTGNLLARFLEQLMKGVDE